jgi:8-oxo-dGTP diphosphatase
MWQVHVVAVALVDRDNRVLVAQRPTGKSLAGLWEFPGGKIEPGETPETALARELAEELGIHVAESALHPLTFVSHAYANFHLVMLLFSCRDWNGTPVGQQGQPLRWEKPDALSALPMPPADVPLLAAIKAFVAVR